MEKSELDISWVKPFIHDLFSRDSKDADSIMAVSDFLKGVTIISDDFEDACKNATTGDFVFM